jgi:hypothetical protein
MSHVQKVGHRRTLIYRDLFSKPSVLCTAKLFEFDTILAVKAIVGSCFAKNFPPVTKIAHTDRLNLQRSVRKFRAGKAPG